MGVLARQGPARVDYEEGPLPIARFFDVLPGPRGAGRGPRSWDHSPDLKPENIILEPPGAAVS
jgi:hypothetical protein